MRFHTGSAERPQPVPRSPRIHAATKSGMLQAIDDRSRHRQTTRDVTAGSTYRPIARPILDPFNPLADTRHPT